MRKIVIESSHKSTLRLVGTGEEKSGPALSPFGPVRAGLITMQRTKEDQVLTELLSSLERKITEANTKSYEVLNTLTLVTALLARRISSSSETIIEFPSFLGTISLAVSFIFCGAFLIVKDKNPFGIGTEGAIASTQLDIGSSLVILV
jgi:hypothetical protein